MPMMHKNPIKSRFIIASPKSSIIPLARTITAVFHFFLDKYKHIMISVGFLGSTVWVVHFLGSTEQQTSN